MASLSCHVNPVSTTFKFETIPIREEDILEKLSKLDVSKVAGPDQISTKLLHMVAPGISASLASLFNASLSAGKFPSEWKKTN